MRTALGLFVFVWTGCGGVGAGTAPGGGAGAGAGQGATGAGGSTGAAGTGSAGTTGAATGGAGTTGAATGHAGTTGADGGAPYTPPPVPAGGMEACAAFAKATCAKRDSCTAGADKGTTIIFGSAALCETRELPKCLATLTARGTNKTPALLTACTASLPQQSCPDYFDNVLTTPCRPIAGTLSDGAPCLSSWQCVSTFCSLPHADVCGVCAPRPKAGDSCADSVCGTGLLCHRSTMTCSKAVADGGACDKNNPCSSGFGCVGNAAAVQGTCKAEGRAVGTACDPKSVTLPGCDKDAGLYCDAAAMQCKTITSAGDGQPCGTVAGAMVVCKAGGLCAGATLLQPGTCKAPVADGVACNDVSGPPCLSPAKCVAGTCRMPDASTCH